MNGQGSFYSRVPSMAADGLAQGAPQCGGFALPGARLPLRLGGDRMPPAELSRWWLDAC